MKKSWILFAPDWSQYDTLWESNRSFTLWPVGNKAYIDHWMDEAVNNGIDEIAIYTADRPAELREHLNNGLYWSIPVTIYPLQSDDKAPADAIPIVGLRQKNQTRAPIDSPAGLLQHWMQLNRDWLDNQNEYSQRVERKHPSGGWVGPKTRIHPSAILEAPFWIHGKCDIGPKAHIGPYACIGENAIIDENASVQKSIVLPGTLVGRNVSLDQVAADGGLLLNAKHGCRVPITDAFILSDIGNDLNAPTLFERIIAATLFVFLAPIIALNRMDWSLLEAHDGRGGSIELKTGNHGRLLTRRWYWLKHVISGRMRLIGILPRPLDWSSEADQEVTTRLANTRPGVFALSDLHDCHCSNEPDEWLHASYQALGAEGEATKLVKNNLWKLALKRVC